MTASLDPTAQALEEAVWVHRAALSGLVAPAGIELWANAWIMKLDEPPYWLIELSTLRSRDAQDYTDAMGPHLGRRLRTSACISLIIAFFERGLVDLETALAKISELWLPLSRMAADDAPDPGDHALFEQGRIPDLLAEWDSRQEGEPLSDDFTARCRAAFQEHLARHGAAPADLPFFS